MGRGPGGEVRSLPFGTELRRMRVRRGMSLAELSRLVSYSKGYLSKIETGDKPATYDVARACDAAVGAGGTLVELAARGQGGMVSPPPAQLPTAGAGFVGRDDEIDALNASREAGAGVVVISGAPGVGKTELALHWAHRLCDRYPDGSLFANLRGYDPEGEPAEPAEVLEAFLRALNVPSDVVPRTLEGKAALLRTRLARRRVLIVLDNAVSTRQVRPLVPGSAGCLLVVTSRSSLSGLAAREGACRVLLDPLPEADAVDLLRHGVGTCRADRESAAVHALAAHCSRLPLALRVAAERARSRPRLGLADIARELASERHRLDALSAVDDATTAVRAVFSWSYRALPPDEARLFRLFGLHGDAETSVGAAAALAGTTPHRARRLLDVLSGVHLLSEVAPGRFRLHDLLRLYAREQVERYEPGQERRAAVRRLVTWYLRSANAALALLVPYGRPDLLDTESSDSGGEDDVHPERFVGYDTALRWCETECDTVVAVTRQANEYGFDELAWKLPLVFWDFWHLQKRWAPWIDAHTIALEAAQRSGDAWAESWVRMNLGVAYQDRHQFKLAFEQLHESYAMRLRIGDEWGLAWSRYALGTSAQAVGHDSDAATYIDQALSYFDETGNLLGRGLCLVGLGDVHRRRGRYGRALTCLERAVECFRALGYQHGEGYAATKLGTVLYEIGRPWDALNHARTSLVLSRQASDHQGEALALDNLALILHELGRSAEAVSRWREAARILDELDDPRAADVRARLSTVMKHAPPTAVQDTPGMNRGSRDADAR
ncbi:tetratricopeptide repeat protein [Haloechinothrix sp. LS1_15]|uniref:ATP-binding protein n=1 Tax=Haloechinothrix sp. LS1_15 TaxID=2652248 RepID=UPI00294ABBF1|nr:tetratricopeptide repeat protein [Haloechinothrix sp. LS1_15]